MTDQRHPYSADLCDRLERVAWGEAAAKLLEDDHRRARFAVVVLPVFAWGHTQRATGRKSNSPTGDLLFPVKIKWSDVPGPVFVLRPPKTTVAVSWEVLGIRDVGPRGQTNVTCSTEADGGNTELARSIPPAIHAPILSGIRARRSLDELVNDGRNARWEILHIFEGNLRWNFDRALALVNAELGLDSMPAIDCATSETIQNHILLGGDPRDVQDRRRVGGDGRSESLALRLIDRCLDGKSFSRVDPEKYVRHALFSSSESAIRRYIGDPQIGRRVRRVANEIGSTDIDLVTDELARRDPTRPRKIDTDRVNAALSTTRRIMEATQSFSFGDLIEDSEENARGGR